MSAGGGQTVPAGSPPRLLERERELGALDLAIAAATASAPGLVVVEGPAGIGKSRLLAEARRRAVEHGLTVLTARGGELERDFPFGIVRQLFEVRLADAELRSRALAGAARAAGQVFGLAEEPAAGEAPGEGTFSTLHGLYWLTVNLCSEGPLLLAVDDLHWCDRASLRFLTYLARRLDDLPLLVVGSLRPSEPGADQALLAELTGDPSTELLVPGPLTGDAVAEVVRDRLGDDVAPAFAAACHDSTNGNPLLLNELLKALVADRVAPDAANVGVVSELGPRAASRAVLLRLARLSADAVPVARAIAVLGDGTELTPVAALAELDADATAAAIRELVRAEILRPESPLGFVHPLVQAAVYRDLAPGERELSHERAAKLLSSLGAPAEQVAAHALAMPARGEDWVVDVLRTAAHAALAKGAPDAAISSLERALGEPAQPELRPQLLLELGAAEAETSVRDAAVHLRGAYEALPDPGARGYAADGLARTLLFMGEPAEAAAVASRARLELPAGLEDLGDRLEALELLSLFFGAPDDGQLERLGELRVNVTGGGPGARMLAAVSAWSWTLTADPSHEVAALSRSALADGQLFAADSGLMTVVAAIPLALADSDDVLDIWEAVRADAHRRGSMFAISGAQLWNGFTQFMRGELADAESELRASIETLELWGIPAQSGWPTAFLAELLVEKGALAEARQLIESAGDESPASDQAVLLDSAMLTLLLAEGKPAEALALSEAAAKRAAFRRHPRYTLWRSATAQALDRLGRRDEAIAIAVEELEIARGWGSPGTVGRSLRVLGEIEREDGLTHLEEACALLASAPALLEQAKALAALGATLRRGRKPTEARPPLRRALELATICGAVPLADHVRAEIHATGARPRAAALRGVGSLTASERRIVDRAATGQSNRDIAQALYVTPKTVEVHLSNAYRKLGVGSRHELAGALATDG